MLELYQVLKWIAAQKSWLATRVRKYLKDLTDCENASKNMLKWVCGLPSGGR